MSVPSSWRTKCSCSPRQKTWRIGTSDVNAARQENDDPPVCVQPRFEIPWREARRFRHKCGRRSRFPHLSSRPEFRLSTQTNIDSFTNGKQFSLALHSDSQWTASRVLPQAFEGGPCFARRTRTRTIALQRQGNLSTYEKRRPSGRYYNGCQWIGP